MATITEKSKGNKGVSFKFHCCVGRDEQGKQHFRTTTWKPPAEGQGVYTSPLPAPCEAVQTAEEVPEEETFRYFAEQVWMPLKVIAGGARPSTIAMYGFMMRVSLPRLGDKRLKDITAVDIMRYLQYLREEYRAPTRGETLPRRFVHEGRKEWGVAPRATYFLLVQKVGKDTLRGENAVGSER